MAIPNQGFMMCSKCGTEKPPIEMSSFALKTERKWRICKACSNTYSATYRNKDREAFRKYHRDWRVKIGYKEKKPWIARRKERISGMTESELSAFRLRETEQSKKLNATLKEQVFNAYGGWKCACCGETEKLFLTIDHMLNNASELRRSGVHGKASTTLYRYLRKSGYPKDFQVLCMNCNFGKRMNNGICPHKTRCNDYPERE